MQIKISICETRNNFKCTFDVWPLSDKFKFIMLLYLSLYLRVYISMYLYNYVVSLYLSEITLTLLRCHHIVCSTAAVFQSRWEVPYKDWVSINELRYVRHHWADNDAKALLRETSIARYKTLFPLSLLSVLN